MLTGAAVEDKNAQAAAAADSMSSSGETSDDEPISVVRRYVPRFVGKREDGEDESKEKYNSPAVPEISELDDAVSSFVNYVNSMNLKDESETEGFGKIHGEDFDEDDSDNFSELEDIGYSLDDDNIITKSQEADKRYQPKFIGKRYNPMFVGKRYKPMFVGKRYQPMFVGKRYQPMFVGKRYQPMFVGKRYQPMFVGKRYNPMFVGKRYTPKFVGKRNAPESASKRYTPLFVGKRDVSDTESKPVEETKTVRRKRSLADDAALYKRAWGRYFPYSSYAYAAYKRNPEQAAFKRFVAPEFIGRRDSLSSILSALDALQYIHHPRSASKRFEAPMFIGKRPFTPTFVGKRGPLRPMFVGKRTPLSDFNIDAQQGFGITNEEFGLNPLAFSPELSEYSSLSESQEAL